MLAPIPCSHGHPVSQALRDALNREPDALKRINKDTDPHILANLIKIFFRMMPERLLIDVSFEQASECETGPQCMQLLQSFPSDRTGLFLWLLELSAPCSP